ncbi:MAG: hypothetical protein IPF93_08260 [Saprospiraceae bacterium]|nr:hypothetical protein [Saprospiraceae bacterium]
MCAYDAHTGALRWIFHTIPQENEAGHDTWQWLEHENYGGTNNWGGMSLDEKRGVVYVANGSPTYDFYGANRLGSNLYGNCVIALDALSGKKSGIINWSNMISGIMIYLALLPRYCTG